MNFLYGNIEVIQKKRLKMGNNSGKISIGLLIILGIFTIGYFLIVNKFSYNFDVNFEEDLYELKIAAIEKQSEIYAKGHSELFSESSDVYLTVEELATENVIISDNDGNVLDPRDSEKTLNELKVKITNKDDEITAKVLV